MSYQALARKYRPTSFAELVGQSAVRTALENALGQGRLHPALLLSGTRGVGKTTLGRIVARCLNCEQGPTATPCGSCSACCEIAEGRFVDLLEVDAASRTKVDETRELLDNVQYAPSRGRYKVYLIDEVHMLSKHSFNALLKTLEEPPPHVQFLLATTDPQKLPVTILSRCLQFHLQRISADDIAARLRHIVGLEQITADDAGLQRLSRAADGSLRDALSLLDQAIAHGGGTVSDAEVAAMLGSIERRDVLALVESLASGELDMAFAAVDRIALQGLDFGEALDELGRLWQQLAVVQLLPGRVEFAAEIEELAGRFAPEDLQVYYQITLHARRDQDWAPDPRSGFEMCLLRLFAFIPAEASPATAAPVVQGARQDRPPAPPAPAVPPPPASASAEAPPAPAAKSATPPKSAPAATGAWPEMVERLQLRGPSLQLARHCIMEEAADGKLRLVLDESGRTMRTAAAEQRFSDAVSEHLGLALDLRDAATPSAVAVKTPAQLHAEAAVVHEQTAQEEFLENSAVRELAAEFGAEVVPDSITVKPAGEVAAHKRSRS